MRTLLQTPARPSEAHVRSLKILLVDDDPSFTDLVGAFLRSEGHALRCAAGPAEALALNRSFLPEFILLDLRLQSASGLHLLTELLMDNTTALVVIMTGYPSTRSAVEALNRGAAGYLEKPLDLDQLKEFLASHLMP